MAVFRMFCRIFVIALIALNVCFTQNSYATPDSAYPFELTTTATDSFQFSISAAGTFYVDCGDGGTLSGTGVSGNTITRSSVTEATYTCSWNTTATHTIRFGGSATGYSTDSTTAAINFNISSSYNDTNVKKISSISGSLGQIFGTVTNPSAGSGQPSFYYTFYCATNMRGTNIDDPNNPGMKYALPPNLFSGISGAPASYMFGYTFNGCSGLNGSIPSGLFGNLSGAPASGMFAGTFQNCSGLNGSIPSGLFGNLTGAPKSYMFANTFRNCSGLTGSIPSGLFGNLSGAPASNMFYYTFYNCSGLTGSIPSGLFGNLSGKPASYMFSSTFYGCSGLSGSIPAGLFGNLSGAPASQMFRSTFYGCSGLSGSIPAGLFGNLSGAPASYMFSNTFNGCSGLTGSIPAGLFGNLSGAPAYSMFAGTFQNCSGLTGFGDKTYVPGTFLSGITDGSASAMVSSMFASTSLYDTCPAGTYTSTRTQFNNAGKPWCSSCPDGTTSLAGSTDSSQCGYNITYNNMENATNFTNAPIIYTPESETITLGTPTKDGYIFDKWCEQTGDTVPASNCTAVTQIASGSTGNKTLYAMWTACGTGETVVNNACVCDTANGYELDNGVCHEACDADQVWNGSDCVDKYKFTLTTTETDSFQWQMSAAGTFYVDCGDSGTLTSTANDVTNNNTITRSYTNIETYTCTWNSAGAHTIRFGGTAKGYDAYTNPAIGFNIGRDSDTNAKKVAGISGSLGQIFGTVTNPSTGSGQPKFSYTFYGATNMRGTDIDNPNNTDPNTGLPIKYALPPDLFSGISGAPTANMFASTFRGCTKLSGSIPPRLFGNLTDAPADSMFWYTFASCKGLTGTIPSGLFGNLSDSPADSMFAGTFSNCSGLTGSIPSELFGNLSGAPASYMFYYTFYNCSGLTGSIPSGLFAGIHGAPANGMFEGTFNGCRGLTGFSDGANTINYVPSTFLANIETNTSVANQVSSMFVGIPSTSLKESCPAGTYDVTRTQFNDAGKPWCEPCPDGKTSPEGSTSEDQCYLPSQTINVKYYFYDTNTSTDSCQYGGVLNLPSTPVRTGYTFTGWTYSK